MLRFFSNAYFQIFLSALLTTTSELFLKRGAAEAGISGEALGLHALSSGATWLGILTYMLSFPCWLYVLRTMPLNIAFSLAAVVHVLVPLASWFFLGEAVGPLRAGGIALILGGIWVIARPLASVEEKL